MSHIQSTSQRVKNKAAIGFGVIGLAAAALSIGLTSAGASPTAPAKHDDSFSFKIVPSPGIKACLPHLGGNAKITTGKLNDTMTVSVHGAPPNSGFDLFVIQLPNKPFGLSWYQSDVQTGKNGVGSATVKGIFDSETFTVSPGGADHGAGRRHDPATAPVPPGPVVQQPEDPVQSRLRVRCNLSDRYSFQRRAARRDSGSEHRELPGQQGPAIQSPPLITNR